MIKVTRTPEAWEVAYKIADAGEYELDKDSQEWAGYPIYRAKENYYSRICDLGCRLEVMKADGTSTNVWIDPKDAAEEKEPVTAQDADNAAEPAHYGRDLAEKIRENTTDFSKISDFYKFVLDNGYKYKTREKLQDGYDRHWKASHGKQLVPTQVHIELPSPRHNIIQIPQFLQHLFRGSQKCLYIGLRNGAVQVIGRILHHTEDGAHAFTHYIEIGR